MAVVSYTSFLGRVVREDRGGTVRDYGRDTLGSTAALYDSSGSRTDEFHYWPYGEARSHTGSSTTPLTFVGTLGYYADSAGRYYVRARVYRADLGRWTTVDPLWPGESAYGYAGGNPASRVDPTGTQVAPPGGGFGGCAVYVCYEETSPFSHIPGHESVCATGPNGGCSGGYYPIGNSYLGPGAVVPNSYPCAPGRHRRGDGRGGTFIVNCVKVASGCAKAARACECVKAHRGGYYSAAGGWLVPLTNNCYTWATSVVDCTNMLHPLAAFPKGGSR
jgi:RHS repeat-associated protein